MVARRAVMEFQQWSGPLPHPEALAAYDRIQVGFANRIVSSFERQSSHRQDMERTVITGNVQAQARGQWFAFVLAAMAIGCGTYLMATGKEGWGFALVLAQIVALVAAFLKGREKQAEELKQKREQADQDQPPSPPARPEQPKPPQLPDVER